MSSLVLVGFYPNVITTWWNSYGTLSAVRTWRLAILKGVLTLMITTRKYPSQSHPSSLWQRCFINLRKHFFCVFNVIEMSRSGIYINIQNSGNSYTALSSFSILCLVKMNLTAKTEIVTQMAEHCSVSNKNSIYQQQVFCFYFPNHLKPRRFLARYLDLSWPLWQA